MSRVRHELITRLWRGRDPYLDLPPSLEPLPQAFAAEPHAYLTEAVASVSPTLIVDIDAASAGAALALAGELKARRLGGVVVAVDTFLGHPSDWLSDEAFEDLGYVAGQTLAFGRFVTGVLRNGLGNYILPLTTDGTTAAAVFAKLGLHPDVVHLGASEDYHAIIAQLHAWWTLLAPGGVLIGRGYGTSADAKQAFDDFFGGQGFGAVPHDGGKCMVRKTAGATGTAVPAPGDVPGAHAQIDTSNVSPAAPLMVVPEPATAPAEAAATGEAAAPRKVSSSFRLGGRPVSVTEGAQA